MDITLDMDRTIEFLVGLLNTPSPTGYHQEAIEYVRSHFEQMAFPGLTMTTTRKGALLVTVPGENAEKAVGMTAHIDTLGLMVREIKSNGRLKCTRLGGLLWGGVESEGVTVRTHENMRYRGTVAPSNTSTHVNRKIHTAERNDDNMEVRLDLRTTNAEETRKYGIEVGDFVFVDPRVERTDAGFIKARFLDDKAGVAAIYGALLALKTAGIQPAQTSHFLIANYEEVGHGGAAGFPPEVEELVTIDMGALGQGQTGDEFSVSICVKDAGGPYHFDLNNKFRRLANANDIPFNMDIYTYYASDGTSFWRAGGDARVGLFGPGVDASHAYERTHEDSIKHTTHLIAAYLCDPLVG